MSGISDNSFGERSLISGSTRRSAWATAGPFSRTRYSIFRFARLSAAAKPAGPAPITITGSLIRRPVAGSYKSGLTPGPSDPGASVRRRLIVPSNDRLRKAVRARARQALTARHPCANKQAGRFAGQRAVARRLTIAQHHHEAFAPVRTTRSDWWRNR